MVSRFIFPSGESATAETASILANIFLPSEWNSRELFYPPPDELFILLLFMKPLRIVTKAFVTFPRYMWAKNAEKI